MEKKEQIIQRLQYQHLSIIWLLKSLPAEKLLLKTAPTKWNINELIAHLENMKENNFNEIRLL